ncbi:BspA family leucine-rich repeat surface protein, partial [Acinetobacter soli]
LSISGMFSECLAFNQDLSSWNVAKVTEMQYLFNLAPLVNFEVKNWAIQNVINMTNMFSGATSFNKDVSAWCAKFNVNVVLSNFLNNSGLSTTNYDNFL